MHCYEGISLCLLIIECYIAAGINVNETKTSCSCDFNKNTSTLDIHCEDVTESKIRDCFHKHRNATFLVFRNSGLKEIPRAISILEHVRYVDFTNNTIEVIDFNGSENVSANIKELYLDFNRIHIIHKGKLDCLISLEKLYLANNSLSKIEHGAFNDNLKQLVYIHIINNDLTLIDLSVMFLPKINEKKVIVNASWNKITVATNSMNVTIDEILPNDSMNLVALHNNFTTVNIEYYLKLLNVIDSSKLYRLASSGFDLRFNPFVCDCSLYPLAEVLRKFRLMDPNNPVFSITCFKPYVLQGKLIYEVPLFHFNCTVKHDCPEACVCIKTIADNLLTITCGDKYARDRLPHTLPKSNDIKINIKSDAVKNLIGEPYLDNVTTLDVSECGVQAIYTNIIPQLGLIVEVYLHDNALQLLPSEIVHLKFIKLVVLTLHGNPFVCDCHTLWVKKWILTNRRYILHQDKIMCGSGRGKGRVLIDVDDSDFTCTVTLTVTQIALIAGGVLVLLILLFITVHYSKRTVQLLLIAYFDIYCFRKKVKSDLRYDVFISHSSKDDDIVVNKLIPCLERCQPPFKLCIDERDFISGKTIVENIITAIESSLTTLLVLSNNFLRSKWCMMEFREAHMRLLREQNINVVIIVLGDLDFSLIGDELKDYMKYHVYLKYSEKYFVSKLLQSLPIRVANSTTTTESQPSSSETTHLLSDTN